MRKETLLAVFAGSIFGLLIAFVIWKTKTTPPNPTATENSNISTTSTTPLSEKFGLTIDKPNNFEVFTQETAIISGMTSPNTWVTISVIDNDYVIQADPNGAFQYEIELQAGPNEVIITAIDSSGASIEENVLLVYSSEFEKKETPSQSDEN